MADLSPTATPQPEPMPRGGRPKVELEGLGKFKLTGAKGNRYKDKFQTMRERYDGVIAKNEATRRELEAANVRLRKIQGENNLLLDAMEIVARGQPTLLQYLLPPHLPPPPDPTREVNGHDYPGNHEHLNGDAMEHEDLHPDYLPTREVNGRLN